MKLVRHGVNTIISAALLVAFGTAAGNTPAATEDINKHAGILSKQGTLTATMEESGKTWLPVARVVPELAQIVFYYPQGKLSATINVDRELESALLPGEFTVFCVTAGAHTLESYFNDRPLYHRKNNPSRPVNLKGAETYFMQVNPQGGSAVLAQRAAAEAELKSMRKQTRIINRASQVKPCQYVSSIKPVRNNVLTKG